MQCSFVLGVDSDLESEIDWSLGQETDAVDNLLTRCIFLSGIEDFVDLDEARFGCAFVMVDECSFKRDTDGFFVNEISCSFGQGADAVCNSYIEDFVDQGDIGCSFHGIDVDVTACDAGCSGDDDVDTGHRTGDAVDIVDTVSDIDTGDDTACDAGCSEDGGAGSGHRTVDPICDIDTGNDTGDIGNGDSVDQKAATRCRPGFLVFLLSFTFLVFLSLSETSSEAICDDDDDGCADSSVFGLCAGMLSCWVSLGS